MADFTTEGSFISIEYDATDLVTLTEPTKLLTEDSYSISGTIVNVTRTEDLIIGSQPT